MNYHVRGKKSPSLPKHIDKLKCSNTRKRVLMKIRLFISNFIRSQAIHKVHAIISQIAFKEYCTCASRINKGKQIIAMLRDRMFYSTYNDNAILQILHEFNQITSPIIHTIENNSIITYDIYTKRKVTYQFKLEISNSAATVSFNGRIFILNHYNGVYEYDFYNRTLNEKKDSIYAKYSMGICESNGEIFSIGGHDGKSAIDKCEKYSTKNNIWRKLPNLNERRSANTTLQFNNILIFALYGFNGEDRCDSIEMLRIRDLENWKMIVPKINECSKRSSMYGIQMSGDMVLLFGGFNGRDLNESYMMEYKNREVKIKRHSDMKKACAFDCTPSSWKFENLILAVDCEMGIHLYRQSTSIWDVLIE